MRLAPIAMLVLAVACATTTHGDMMCWRHDDATRCRILVDDGTVRPTDPPCEELCRDDVAERASCVMCCERPVSFACNADRLRSLAKIVSDQMF